MVEAAGVEPTGFQRVTAQNRMNQRAKAFRFVAFTPLHAATRCFSVMNCHAAAEPLHQPLSRVVTLPECPEGCGISAVFDFNHGRERGVAICG